MKKFIAVLFSLLILLSCADKSDSSFKLELAKVPASAKFVSDTMSIWGGSLVKGDDGLYHMYYSRWPKKLGWAWVTHSEIAHAVSVSPFGPFEFREMHPEPYRALISSYRYMLHNYNCYSYQ